MPAYTSPGGGFASRSSARNLTEAYCGEGVAEVSVTRENVPRTVEINPQSSAAVRQDVFLWFGTKNTQIRFGVLIALIPKAMEKFDGRTTAALESEPREGYFSPSMVAAGRLAESVSSPNVAFVPLVIYLLPRRPKNGRLFPL